MERVCEAVADEECEDVEKEECEDIAEAVEEEVCDEGEGTTFTLEVLWFQKFFIPIPDKIDFCLLYWGEFIN